MSKSVSSIIQQLSRQSPNQIPVISKACEADLQQLNQYFKKGDKSKLSPNSLVVLKIIDCDIRKLLQRDDYLNPLLNINYNASTGKYLNQARVKLCDQIILRQDLQRLSIVDFHLNFLQGQKDLNQNVRAKMALIRANRFAIAKEFFRAANAYFDATRRQAFVNNQQKKRQIIQKAIAFTFLSPENAETHRLICSLFLNQIAQKCRFSLLVEKLYTRQMISIAEVAQIATILPKKMQESDCDGLSCLNKATFSHNMACLLRTFSCISFKMATELIGISINQLLILIEKTYKNRQVLIDQVGEFLYLSEQNLNNGTYSKDGLIKQFLEGVDDVLNSIK